MGLPFLPMRKHSNVNNENELINTLETRINTLREDVDKLYIYLQDFIDSFPNATGEAIDPTLGEGGDGSLTITDIPFDIIYTPGSDLSFDQVLFGHIDISFTLPNRAVNIVARYKEVSVTNFELSQLSTSPARLGNLKVGTTYHIQIAGQAANGDVGPFSLLTILTIPTSDAVIKAPADAQYIVMTANAVLINEVLITDIQHNSLAGLTLADPHTQYQEEDEKNVVNGYAGLNTVSRTIKGVDTVDDVIVDSITTGIVLKSANGHYWRSTISNTGVLTWVDLGTTKP